jgi:hypothetical protein
MATVRAGVQILGGLQGPVAFPNQTAAGTATWVTENPGSDVADSNLLLSQITLSPKSLMSSTSYSRQLLAQSVIDVDGMVRQDLARDHGARARSRRDQRLRCSRPADRHSQHVGHRLGRGGTNGATPTYTHLVDLETQVTAANADQWPLSYLVHPTSRGTFKKATSRSRTPSACRSGRRATSARRRRAPGQPGAPRPG